MQAPGPAQIELIRRYARTLRHLQAGGGRFSRPRGEDREQRVQRQATRLVQSLDGGDGAGGARPSGA